MDFMLTIARKTDNITVMGSAQLLDTSDVSVNTLIGNWLADNLSLSGRSFSSGH